jgi:hypothetical protein
MNHININSETIIRVEHKLSAFVSNLGWRGGRGGGRD